MPGGHTGWHSHPGPVFVTIQAGTMTFYDADDLTCSPGIYATGWIKRGPVGLIGHTKSDAAQTIELLLSDVDSLVAPASPEPNASSR